MELLYQIDAQRARQASAINIRMIPTNAASEDRTHDLGIMRPTRYQLRYSRSEDLAIVKVYVFTGTGQDILTQR